MSNKLVYVYLMHIFYVAPSFLFMGFKNKSLPKLSVNENGNSLRKLENLYLTQSNLFLYMGILGILNLFYHAYSLYNTYNTSKYFNNINLMHILFVAPLLIYIGFIGKEKTSYVYFDLLKVLGFGVLIVFIYKLYKFYNH